MVEPGDIEQGKQPEPGEEKEVGKEHPGEAEEGRFFEILLIWHPYLEKIRR